MSEIAKINGARSALRGCITRNARGRMNRERIPSPMVWAERQLLFSLVHEMVCQCREYDPSLDAWLGWACWFLRYCEGQVVGGFENEDAVLLLILGSEYAEPRHGAWGERDFDAGDESVYDERI